MKNKKIICPNCDGTKKDEEDNNCSECKGEGYVQAIETKQIIISGTRQIRRRSKL